MQSVTEITQNTFTFGRLELRAPHVYRSWLRAIGNYASYITSIGAELQDARYLRQEITVAIPSPKLDHQIVGQVGELSRLGYGEDKSYVGMLPFTYRTIPSTNGDCMCWATRARVAGLACFAMERNDRIVCALLSCDDFFRSLKDQGSTCAVCDRKMNKRLEV